MFSIANFRLVLNVLRFLLGNSPASEFYTPMKMEQTECFETSVYKIQTRRKHTTCLMLFDSMIWTLLTFVQHKSFFFFLFKIFIFRPFCRPSTLSPGAAIPFVPPSCATYCRPQTSGNCCKICSDSLICLISVGHIHDILNVISQKKVVGHQVWGSQRQRSGFTSHLFRYTANCAVATVQADEIEIFQQDGCDARSDRFPIVGQWDHDWFLGCQSTYCQTSQICWTANYEFWYTAVSRQKLELGD